MKTIKILFTLVVCVMMSLTVNAQAKKDTTVIFKLGIHCPSCKAKLDKDMPFEKGIKDYKLNMKDTTLLITFRMDKNTVPALKAAIERHDVKVLGMCDKDGKMIQCGKGHKCCKEGVKEECKGSCGDCEQKSCEKKCDSKCDQKSGDQKCEGECGDNCCSKTGKKDECCKKK